MTASSSATTPESTTMTQTSSATGPAGGQPPSNDVEHPPNPSNDVEAHQLVEGDINVVDPTSGSNPAAGTETPFAGPDRSSPGTSSTAEAASTTSTQQTGAPSSSTTMMMAADQSTSSASMSPADAANTTVASTTTPGTGSSMSSMSQTSTATAAAAGTAATAAAGVVYRINLKDFAVGDEEDTPESEIEKGTLCIIRAAIRYVDDDILYSLLMDCKFCGYLILGEKNFPEISGNFTKIPFRKFPDILATALGPLGCQIVVIVNNGSLYMPTCAVPVLLHSASNQDA